MPLTIVRKVDSTHRAIMLWSSLISHHPRMIERRGVPMCNYAWVDTYFTTVAEVNLLSLLSFADSSGPRIRDFVLILIRAAA